MNPTTEKTTVSQNDYNNLADWAKPSYQVSTATAPTLNQTNNQIQQSQPQASLSITPQSLQQVPQIKVPNIQNTNTTASGVIASTQPSIETAQANFNQAQQAVGTQAQDAQIQLNNLAQSIFGQKADAQANQVNLENQLGLQEQQKALAGINTEIANEQVALRGEQEKLRQGFATEAQKQISSNTLNDTYGRRLADLAIRQSAANQNITAIQANAERQTKLLTAPLDTKIQYLSTFAKDNVDYLTQKDKDKLAFLTDDLKTQKQDIQALQNAKTQMITEIANNGGGTNTALIKQIQDAKDMGSVASIAANSGFIGKLDRTLKQAQISKIYQDMAESRATADAKKGNLVLNPVSAARIQSEVKDINNLINDKGGMGSAVGTSIFSRAAAGPVGKTFKAVWPGQIIDAKRKLSGETQNFIAGVEQLRQQTTLDKLTEAKANGATFGALSDGERQTLSAASTRLGTWAITDKDGKVLGYNTSEANFKNELDKINTFKELDYIRRGGNPADVGVIVLEDGNLGRENWNGTYQILNIQ